MDSSSRIYRFLNGLPADPDNPERVDELLVVAFTANDSYYVCWKNAKGEFRHDGAGLPTRLHNWLFPADGSTRDFTTLQVVLSNGDEYFASDRNGRISDKDPTSPVRATAAPASPHETRADSIKPTSPVRSNTLPTSTPPAITEPAERPLPAPPEPSPLRRTQTQAPFEPAPLRRTQTQAATSLRPRAQTSPMFRFATQRSQPQSDAPRPSSYASRRMSWRSAADAARRSGGDNADSEPPRPVPRMTFRTAVEAARRNSEDDVDTETPRPTKMSFRTAETVRRNSDNANDSEPPRYMLQRMHTDFPRRKSRPLSISFNGPPSPIFSEAGETDSGIGSEASSVISRSPTQECYPDHYHLKRRSGRWGSYPPPPKTQYADACIQTDPLPELEQTKPQYTATSTQTDVEEAVAVQAGGPGFLPSAEMLGVPSEYPETLEYEESQYGPQDGPAPFRSGGMLEHVFRPGYQLGDMLSSSYYTPIYYVYEEVAEPEGVDFEDGDLQASDELVTDAA